MKYYVWILAEKVMSWKFDNSKICIMITGLQAQNCSSTEPFMVLTLGQPNVTMRLSYYLQDVYQNCLLLISGNKFIDAVIR